MDAMAFMFSVARENSSNVLEFDPECIMQEDLMSLSSKFPLIPGSQRSITFCTTSISQKLREIPADADFDLTDPYNPPPRYNVLHDPHLKEYFQNQAMRRRLVEKGFITNSGFVKCTLLEFNMFRQWIRKLKLDRIHQDYRRERQMELQLWKERQAREQLLRDEELYSIVREREQKAREMKERGAKRRAVDRRKYLKLQEIDRRRREKYIEDMRQKRDLNESRRDKNLAEKQVAKAKKEEKVNKIKIRLLVKRSSEDKKRENMLQKRRQTLIEEKERKLKENWKRRCSLSLARQEEKRKQEEEERLEHERNVARRTSIVAQQRRKSRVHLDMCLQKRRSTLEKQHQQAENFLEKIREKKLKDLERWKQKHARMRERRRYQVHRGSLQSKAIDLDHQDRRRSRLSSVWDLESSLRSEFGIEDNVVYSGVVFAGRKTKRDARQSVQLEAVAEEGTYEETDESARFEKLWSRLEAELALRERVHYVVFGIISNAEEVLNQRERQETYKKIPKYVQGIVDAAQGILANEQINDGDVRAKVRNYILQVIEDASLDIDDSGLLLSSDAKTRRKAREIVTNAINSARDVSFRNTAKEVVAAAIRGAAQKSAQDISKDLAESAKDVVAAAIISATCYSKDAHQVIAARSLAVDAAKAAEASLERLYGVKRELDVGKQRDARKISASLDRCAKDVAAASIISATRSLERVIDRDKCDVIAARTLATDALTAAKASLERLYSVKFEEEDDDQDYYKAVSKSLVKSAKEIGQAVISPAARLLEKTTGKDDLEDLTAQWLANDAIQAARASLENLYGIKVEEKDQNEQAAKDIAAVAVLSAARSLQRDLISNDRDFAMAARGLASNALDSAKASVDWIYSTKVATETDIEGKENKMYLDFDQVAKDIAEVAVDSATRSLERIADKHEWDLTATTRKLANDVLNSAKASLEKLYGIKCEPEEVPILASQETSQSSLEYPIPSTKGSSESVKGHERELWTAAQSLAKDAWKSATASLERLYNIADQMEDNIKHTALDISKTLMDSSGNLRQKLEKEGLSVAARDLACNAIVSAAKAFPKLQEDETSLQDIAESDTSLLNSAAKVSTVSARASLGELFDRGFIGGLELEEATGYLATHAMVSAENLLDTLQDETATLDLDLEICKAATELASRAVVSAEGSVARLAGEHQTSNDRDTNNGNLFWKVTTYVEGLINGALRHLGADGYIVDISDDQEQYDVLTHDQAHLADAEYGTHVEDIYQREILALKASRIVNDVVENAMEIVKTRMTNESFFAGQSVGDGGPRNARFARRRSSSVHFNEKSIFRSRRDSLSIANRPPTPRFMKGRAGSVVAQEIDELERELAIPSEIEVTATNASSSGPVPRRSSDPGLEFYSQDVASSRPDPSASDSKIDINEQGTSLNEKLSVYDIIKRREETASCEISPCESYVVLPQLNPSERSLIAARVESYEVLWKQRKSTPSVTSLPSLSPKGSFVTSESVEQAHSRKESKSRSVPSSSRLPDISSSTSKIYSNSPSASSLKGTSGHPKRTSSQKLKKSPKASPKTSRESVKLNTKPSTDKGLQSPRASVGEIKVTSGTSLRKNEGGSRRSSSNNVTVVTPKGSVKDIPFSQRGSNTKVVLSPSGSQTKATLSQRTSTKEATMSKSTPSQNVIKSSPQSSKLFARASTEKAISSSRTSLGKASPRGSRERAVLTPRESTERAVLAPRGSNQKVTSSPRTSREKVDLSSRTSKGNVTLSPRASAGDTALSPRASKGKITKSPRASTENAALSRNDPKGNATTGNKDQSPRASTENAALSPRASKGKITQSPRASTNNAALSPSVSKGKATTENNDQSPRASTENAALSPRVSKQKVIQSPRASTENAALSPRVSKEVSVQSARASSKNVAVSPRASKGKISQSPRGSSDNATLSSRDSKGNVLQSSHASTENVVLTPRASNENAMPSPSPSKEKLTPSPRGSAEKVALSPRVSQGKVTQSPRASAERIALSSRESKEKVEGPSSFSTANTTLSSKSEEIVPPKAKDDSASSPSVEQPASLQRISLHKVSPTVTQSDQEVSASPKTTKSMVKTPSNHSGKPLDSQDTMKKTESTEKSKTNLKTLSHSGEKLTQELASSAQTPEKAAELDRGSAEIEGRPPAPIPDVPQPQEAGSEGDRFDANKGEAGGESIEPKNLEFNKSSKRADYSLERLILDKRLTPEGAEADTRPASSADVAASRKHTDPSAAHKTIPAQLESSKCVKSSLTEAPVSISGLPRSSREKTALKESDVEKEVFTARKKPEGEDRSEFEGVTSGAGNALSKKEEEKKGSVSKISDALTKENQVVQRPATNQKDKKDFEGHPIYRKVSVSRSIHDTVDDIVQRMLDTADEPNAGFEDSRPTGSGSRERMRRDSEINFDAPRGFGRERMLPTGKVSRTVMETVDFMVQSVSSSDERRPRQSSGRRFSGGITRTTSSKEKLPKGATTSGQDISCVYGVSPSPPTGPQPKLPSPKRSRLRATSSQDSLGIRATQSDSSILSSSSDKAADLRPKVSGAWLDSVIGAGGDASLGSQSPKRPSSSPTFSQQRRRSSERLLVKNSLEGVSLATDGSVGNIINYAAQGILANEQINDGDVRAKVRNYILQVIEDASLDIDDSGLLLSSDAKTRRKAREIVTNAINTARDVSFRNTAKEVVAAAIRGAAQKSAQDISKDLAESAKDVVAAAIISATCYNKDAHQVIAARSLAVDAANAAKASLERLYGVKRELVVCKQRDARKSSVSLDRCAKDVATASIISATRSLDRVIDKDKCDVIAARTLATDALTAAKASLERLYSVKFEEEDDDQDYYKAVSKSLVKSAKEIGQAVVSPAARLLEKTTGKDDLEDLTAQWLANDAIQEARASLENLHGIKVEEKDQNEQAAKDIAAVAVLSAARSLQRDLISNDRDFAMAARGLASNALDSAKASVDWIYSTKVATETEIVGKDNKMYPDLDQVAKDIAEVAVDSATRSLERIAVKHEWDLTATTRKLANDVLNSAKESLERLYGIKCEPEEVPILASQETSQSSLEYPIPSTKDSSQSVKGHEQELWTAAQSLAKDAWKSATASLERLYNIADQMEDNIKHTALDISKTLMDSSGNLRQKLEKEGLAVAARDLACNAIVSAAKAFPKLQEDETSLQDIAGSDTSLLNAAAKVSTVSARASLGELFDRGFIGSLELEEATGYLATHAVVSAENLLDTLQDETATLDLDLEICKAATELASRAVVSAEGSVARLAGEHQTSNDRDTNDGNLFWKVTTYVEGLINGALRHLGAEGYIVDINDDQEQFEVLTHDQARSADVEYGTHVEDIYQREILALKASRIVNDVVESAMEIVKTRMTNESFFAGQSVGDGGPRNARFARRRSSSVHFNEKSIFRSRRDSLSIANRPPTPRFMKGLAGSVVTQEIDELEKELGIPSEIEVTATNASSSGPVPRRSSDPGLEFHSRDGASSRPDPSASDSKIDVNEQGTSLNEKLSVYEIIKRREETASCEISPCESYVVLPQLNPSERSLIAARVESYEVLWKQRMSTPSVTSLPSLSPKGSFVASESAEQAHPRKESKSRSVPSSSHLPDISSSTSKIYSNSASASSLKGTSGHPKRTSSQKLKKSPKASPKTSRESVKLNAKPSTEKGLQSPRASAGEIKVTSGTSLRKNEGGSRRSSSNNVTVVTPKGSVKDMPSSQRGSNTKVVLSPSGSQTKATLSQRTSTKEATMSKSTPSQNLIKSSPQSSKLFARASVEKTISSSRTSLGKASPRGSRERAVLTPRESTERAVLAPRGSNQKVTSSPRTSREKVDLSSRTSKGNVTLSPRASAGDTALSPRASKGKITQSSRASTENAALSPSVSKGKATTENKDQSPRASTENAALSPRASKGKITHTPGASTNNAALSPSVSKGKATAENNDQSPRASTENAALSPRVSKQKVIQSPRASTENAALSPSVSKEVSVQSARASSKNVAVSPRASKGKISQSKRGSSENATLRSRVSKGNVMQSSNASTENVVLTPRASNENAMQFPPSPSKEKITPSPRGSAGKVALSPRVSKGKVTQSPRASAEKMALSSRESKEKVEAPSSFSAKNTTPPSKSKEIVPPKAKDASASSPSVEQPASLQRISLHKVTPTVTQSDQEVSAFPKTSKAMVKTPSSHSGKPLDSQDTVNKTESTEKSKTDLKTLSRSAEKLTQELASSAQTPEKAAELDRDSAEVEGRPPAPIPDVSQPQAAGSEGDRFDANKGEEGGESIEPKNLEFNKSSKRADHSLERLILDKRLTPEGAEADTRPASSADVAASRKHTDPSASHKTIPPQLESSKCVKSSLTEAPASISGSPRSSREKTALKESDVEKEVFTARKKPEGEDRSEFEGVTSGAGTTLSKKEEEKKGSVSKISNALTKENQVVQRPATNQKDKKDFEGHPIYRKVSVSRSIHDTVDDIVQRMLDTADEPNAGFEDSRPTGSGSRERMRRDSEINFDAPRGFVRERMLPTGKVSRTVMETVDFMVQSVSSSDERRPRQSSGRRFSGGITRTTSSKEKLPKGATTSGQDISCVYGVSPSPPTGPQPKLPSPKRSRLRATSSQDSLGIRATQSDSSILSSSSDKAADLRPKVSGAWLDSVIAAGGDASLGSQSPKRPSSSPTSSQQRRRSSERLLVKNSLEGVSLATDGSVGKIN
ncbi:uncharacterized protein LOC144648540 [Oculina patagonica]